MRHYRTLFEKRQSDFKAWYNPHSDFDVVFNKNTLHGEMAEQMLHMDELTALEKGYIRISVDSDRLDIETTKKPTDQEFMATQAFLSEKVFVPKVRGTIWDVTNKGYFIFNEMSFFLTDDFSTGKYARYGKEK